jgi:hypothetical protein
VTEQPSTTIPTPAVLDAFGVKGAALPLAGGQGRSVRVGGFVFKPAEGTDDEVEWAASLFETLAPNRGFRIPLPLRASDGRCIVDGWTASEFLTGEGVRKGIGLMCSAPAEPSMPLCETCPGPTSSIGKGIPGLWPTGSRGESRTST